MADPPGEPLPHAGRSMRNCGTRTFVVVWRLASTSSARPASTRSGASLPLWSSRYGFRVLYGTCWSLRQPSAGHVGLSCPGAVTCKRSPVYSAQSTRLLRMPLAARGANCACFGQSLRRKQGPTCSNAAPKGDVFTRTVCLADRIAIAPL
jgi:hypothetical protein